jgi:hypothetical protein
MGSYAKYEIDNESVGPTARRKIWNARVGRFVENLRDGFANTGASIKTKFNNSSSVSVNMNRGNSQFIQPIPQHSRSNSSALSAGQGSNLTTRDRVVDWWTRFTADVNFNWRLRNLIGKNTEPIDPFVSTRAMKEAGNQSNPDFSKFLAMKDSELRAQADRRRRSLSQSQQQLGSLGLDFSESNARNNDPFADPSTSPSKLRVVNPTIMPSDAGVVTLNPFVDPPTVPKPVTATKVLGPANYVADIRRSRGQSISGPSKSNTTTPATRYPSTIGGPASRYPSTIVTNRSHDSFRSSIGTSFSMNPRKKAGRSDPFDLDSLALATSPPSMPVFETKNYPPQTAMARNSGLSRITQSPTSTLGGMNESRNERMAPRVVSGAQGNGRVVSETGTYSSKYSSGASALMSQWGDPGPDLGPGGLARLGSQKAVFESGDSSPLDEDEREVYNLRRKASQESGKSVGKAV